MEIGMPQSGEVIGLSCIVEGHGEVEAVPILIRRLINHLHPSLQVRIPAPIRIPKTKLVRPGELEKAVELAARKAGAGGAVFILLDSDDDCPADSGPELLLRAQAVRSDVPFGRCSGQGSSAPLRQEKPP